MYATDGLTMGFDSTTQGGVHVNAINIHNAEQFVLAVDELAGMADQYNLYAFDMIYIYIYILLVYSPFSDMVGLFQ